jgi:hypothetical protein
MTEPYVALRVPISLLHQKVFSTSHRLEKWTGVVLPEKKEVTVPKIDTSRVISPCAASSAFCNQPAKDNDVDTFKTIPYLRRFFEYVNRMKKLQCRVCGEFTSNSQERMEHQACYKACGMALDKLVKDGLCVVCEKKIDREKVKAEYNSIPVCDDNCMLAWEWFSPEAFQLELEIAKTDILEEEIKKSNGSVRNFFSHRLSSAIGE